FRVALKPKSEAWLADALSNILAQRRHDFFVAGRQGSLPGAKIIHVVARCLSARESCSESGGKGRSSKVHARREGIVDRAARAYQKIFCRAGIFLSPSFGIPELTTSKRHENFFERSRFFLAAWKTCQPRKEPNSRTKFQETNPLSDWFLEFGSWNFLFRATISVFLGSPRVGRRFRSRRFRTNSAPADCGHRRKGSAAALRLRELPTAPCALARDQNPCRGL